MASTKAQLEKKRRHRQRLRARQAAYASDTCSVRARAKQRRRELEDRELLLTCKRENSAFMYHPALELLPRVVPNPLQEPMHDAELIMLQTAQRLGLDCQYEPFLFQMYDTDYGCRLATSPDLWLPSLGLVVEIGYVPNKSRKIRNLRQNFSRMRFGVITTRSVMAMPHFDDQLSFVNWIMAEVAASDQKLAHLKAAEVAGEAYRRAIADGASAEAAAAHAQKELRRF